MATCAITDLGALGGGSSLAPDVSNSGQVVGASWTSSGAIHPFVDTSGGGLIDLGAIGGNRSHGYGINDSHQIVGWATNAGDRKRAFVCSSGIRTNLNCLIDPLSGWQIEDARDINDAAQIAAFGCQASSCHGLLLTPVSEPQTWAMLLAGLGFVGLRRRMPSFLSPLNGRLHAPPLVVS